MKNKLIFILILLLLVFTGCSNKESDDEMLKYVIDKITFEETASEKLNFETEYIYKNNSIQASWESDDEKIIDNTGKVYKSIDEQYVTVVLTLTLNDATLSKGFSFKVEESSITDMLYAAAGDLQIPKNIVDDIELSNQFKYGQYRINCEWMTSNNDAINTNGNIGSVKTETQVKLTCKLSYNKTSVTKDFTVKIIPFDIEPLKLAFESITLPSIVEDDLDLIDTIKANEKDYAILWKSDNKAISEVGKISYVENETPIKLTAYILWKGEELDIKSYNVTLKSVISQSILQSYLDDIVIPKLINNDILLSTYYNGIRATWTSDDENIITASGVINKNLSNYQKTKLHVQLNAGELKMTKDFDVSVGYEKHMFIDRTFKGNKVDTEVSNDKLVLLKDALSGTYETEIIETDNFSEAVGSWAAITSEDATVEFLVRVRVGDAWSKYLSYGKFGKGLKNSYSDQSDQYVKLSTDEILFYNGKKGDAFQLKVILRRTSLNIESPVVSLLAFTMDFDNYTFDCDISNLPKEVKHDVVKLYQHDVPEIGGSICSATSSTMLLMWKGYSFDGLASYPHQYIAGIVKDYGHNIFGNWTYNTVGMSSFGAISYVKRFISEDDLFYHLATVGPVAASIKGYTITDNKSYNTNGHLIVVTGYLIDGNNKYVYTNDPNVPGVSTRMKLQDFLDVYRNVSYIIE